MAVLDSMTVDPHNLPGPTLQDLQSQLLNIKQILDSPFYERVDFWIMVVIGVAGIVVAYLAYIEAGNAKQAAIKAGRSVKIQTITIELSEIAQRLDKLETGISYSSARDFLNEIARRLRRLISPFQDEADFKQVIANLKAALDAAKKALADVRPENTEETAVDENEVYYGIEGHLSTISGSVADLIGIFEKDSLHE